MHTIYIFTFLYICIYIVFDCSCDVMSLAVASKLGSRWCVEYNFDKVLYASEPNSIFHKTGQLTVSFPFSFVLKKKKMSELMSRLCF